MTYILQSCVMSLITFTDSTLQILFRTKEVKTWEVDNSYTRREVQNLILCGKDKGVVCSTSLPNLLPNSCILKHVYVQQTCRQDGRRVHNERGASAKRLDDMFIIDKLIFKEQPPTFLLCVVPGRKSDIYGLSYLA